MLEAKGYYNGYTPSLQEYLDNAWVSVAMPTVLLNTYFSATNPITKEALDFFEECPNILRWSSMIIRLVDDLGTSKVCRTHYPKSIINLNFIQLLIQALKIDRKSVV